MSFVREPSNLEPSSDPPVLGVRVTVSVKLSHLHNNHNKVTRRHEMMTTSLMHVIIACTGEFVFYKLNLHKCCGTGSQVKI